MDKLSAALVAFQAECPVVPFDKKNDHFKNKYATLPAILDVIRPVLAKHGLAVVQFPIFEEGRSGCETHIIHSSGETMVQRFAVPISKNDPQGACAAVTYARRYGLSGALGLVIDEDDDGNQASGIEPKPSKISEPVRRPNEQPKPRESVKSSMSNVNKTKLAYAAKERIKELGDETIQVRELIRTVAQRLARADETELLDSDFEKAFVAVQGFEP